MNIYQMHDSHQLYVLLVLCNLRSVCVGVCGTKYKTYVILCLSHFYKCLLRLLNCTSGPCLREM